MSSSSELVWVITGTSSGLGREFALEALARGDKVIATARPQSLGKLDDLKEKGAATLGLDVTASLQELRETASDAVKIYGRVDALVNNAGYVLVGAIEENTPEETQDQFQTNVFGGLNVARAFLPYMREKKSGTIVWIGSLGGWVYSPYMALYAATKWTLRAISHGLHEEIAPFGLRSVCVDFGYFRTPVLENNRRALRTSRIPDYKEMTERFEAELQVADGNQPGDPVKGAKALVDLLHDAGLAKGKHFPTGVLLGSDCYNSAKEHSKMHMERVEEWEELAYSTDF
ncbi:short chain dehydrogenase [Coprinopsis marcescibilis]|uniref:Short chain dehydrogenase n=1 Tax=Coprinopsis marcescibilis TaxID=230819 RepID=A0A5C3KE46_COPMA|nr:short chain dehydrogenase [Coprinopsis marcescibilis]